MNQGLKSRRPSNAGTAGCNQPSLLQDEPAHLLHEVGGTAYGQTHICLRFDVKTAPIDSHIQLLNIL
jgi:hypothetical protein